MNEAFVRAAELLPVPRPDRVRPQQADGITCVWCGEAPTVNLGPRLSTSTGATPGPLHRWHPRACAPCAEREAGQVLSIHTERCARCLDRDHCPDARALHQLADDSRSRPAVRRPDR
ncbi:hypothetical protein JL475_10285 [Streptomyces sp. M2CJ-2]|uniref:hypothetical protein n=1 Tax=Streptomyces sp. M2CJ-2 TaxID=2803948 RepID=UPI001920F1FD|nr:hypothetical protein [Streptomyces sp. M2CJ-2]MBL3666372.1 hypothetical protein [Streptomyces sp. M2CJ-2]